MGLRDTVRPRRRYEDVADGAGDDRPWRHGCRRIEKSQEFLRENAASEREKLGDEDIGPCFLERLEEPRAPRGEVIRAGGLSTVVEEALELRPGHMERWQLHESGPAK